jgi:hypothetical protein
MKAKRIITSISLLLILLSVCYFAIKMPFKKPVITHDITNHSFLKRKTSALTKKPISNGKYLCANALRPLKIRDYTGYNQPMHPKVLYFNNAWNDWKYWMSYTPYPKGDAVFENPSVAVSNDGINWSNPPGMRNPVIKQPQDAKRGGHNSDPHLVFMDNKLQLWYRYNPAKFKHYGVNYNINQIFMTYTSDGIHWSKPKLIFNDKYSYLSPVILYDDGVYKVWFSDNDGKLHYKQSSDLISWSAAQTVNLKLPGYRIWHQDIIKNNGQYEIVFSAYKKSGDNQNLYFAESSDGINFTKPHLILKPSESKSALDNQMIYRSSLVNVNGKYKLYYSAMSRKHDWHIFLTDFNINPNI